MKNKKIKKRINKNMLLISGIILFIVPLTFTIKFFSKEEINSVSILDSVNKEIKVDEEENDIYNEKGFEEEVVLEQEKNDEFDDRVETIEIAAVGDFLMHMGVVNSAYNYNTGEYDFTQNLEYVKEYLSSADLTIANIETTFAGPERGYSGYPCFNSPDQLVYSMRDVGIDIINNISNHSLDTGEKGFLRTRQVIKESGLETLGTRGSEEENRYIIKEIDDIKVGIIGYGYTTEGDEGGRGLNGIPIPENLFQLMNCFNPDDVDSDLQEMKIQIEKMKKDGADAIVFYMHWGEEYQLEPNESQLKITKFLANEGVDVIFGDHPHTIQPIDILKSDDGKHQTVVIYSLGNFISNQRQETVGNPYTADGVIVYVKITKDFSTGEVIAHNPEYLPTWIKVMENGSNVYKVVPSEEYTADYLSSYESTQALNSFNRTVGVVESYNDAVEVFGQ
ncbi:CapA family protein [Clostridioides difficile]